MVNIIILYDVSLFKENPALTGHVLYQGILSAIAVCRTRPLLIYYGLHVYLRGDTTRRKNDKLTTSDVQISQKSRGTVLPGEGARVPAEGLRTHLTYIYIYFSKHHAAVPPLNSVYYYYYCSCSNTLEVA